ncbi:hypothetical protein [Microbacterium aurantiacum]|uniref:Multidrug ABC transporter ATPase n=2 Tax=Microbacterium aurantiacum TaxID=162393 RepID=A0AAJ2HJT9_9MICO|nr:MULTISPECIES: hypothetical protein [Microbacterium]ODT09617.1 MAG: multidrug ABC transporter ATPase [Microbacterium sp. SCN 70-18]ANG86233.1 multidrug ABC transporter ATPase [Microbacterium chocolatum]KOS10863.1 multidrug ABC transporter ATPase [Microbacterium chocolatum]MBN9202618.1 multidrug ABC transporter ATPase [Microbacterium chocolatum]MDN4465166.1 multidrug ABC transporter ATPase [Microbacterium aurantiacum]
MSTRAPGNDVPIRPIDRLLSFMSLGLLILSVVCFFAIMIGSSSGADMQSGVWPAVAFVPLFGLPIAFLLLLAVLIMSFVRRARANKGD